MFQGTIIGWTKDSPVGNSFLGLVDTPVSYVGMAYMPLRVGPLEDRVEFDLPRFTAVNLWDTDSSNIMSVIWNEDDTVDRTLNILLAGGNRSLTIEADSLINQDLTTDAFPNFAGVDIADTDASNYLRLFWNEDDVADRTLNFLVAGGDRSLTIEADSLINQDVTTDAFPNFAGVDIADTDASNYLRLFWNEDDTADRTLNFLVVGGNRSLTIEADSIVNQDLTTDADVYHGSLTYTTLYENVSNASGAQLDAERVVKASGHGAAFLNVVYMAAVTDEIIGIVTANIADATDGRVITDGPFQTSVDTTGSAVNDPIYVDATGNLNVTTGKIIGRILTVGANAWIYVTAGSASLPNEEIVEGRLAALDVDGAINLINTDLSLYQVPAGKYLNSSIKITVCNRNDALVTYRVAHVDGAIGAVANEDYLEYDNTLLPYESKIIEIDGMEPTDSILVRSDTTNITFAIEAKTVAVTDGWQRLGATTVVASTDTALYVAAGDVEKISVVACNKDSANPSTIRIAICDGAIGTLAAEDYRIYEDELNENETRYYNFDALMENTYTIVVYATDADTNFIAYGREVV